MRLLDSLYCVVTEDSEGGRYGIRLLRDCEIYKCHFPDRPITPGVCIIRIGCELAERKAGVSLELQTVVNAKFLAVIDPDETTDVCYEFKRFEREADGIVRVQAVVKDEARDYAKLSLLLSERH